MPININTKLSVSVDQQSIGPVISSLQNSFKNNKIPLQVELKIPKDVDKEVYRANRAFQVLDQRLISLKIHAAEALFNVGVFAKQISTVGQDLNKALQPATKSLDTVARSVTNVANTVNKAEAATGNLAEAIGSSTKRFISFAVAAGSIANIVFQLQRGFAAALQFDRELVKFKQIGNDSATIIKGISDEVTRLSKDLGVSSSELIKSAITLRQAGLSAQETKTALDALAKTALSPSFDSLNNTTEAVIATLAQFGKGAGALEKQLGSINKVSADFAVESGDLTEAIRRTGGAFVAAGGNLEELLALFTSVRATTRESADSIATAFRTIFARLQRPDAIRNLRDIGVELQDMEGRFVGPYEAIKRLNQAFGDLPQGSPRFAQIVEEIGGIRQISKVIPLIQQFSVATKAYNSALEGQTSLTDNAAIAQDAFLVKIQKVKESFLELFRTIVSNDAFRLMLDSIISTTKAITEMVSALKPLIPLLTAAAAIQFGRFLAFARPSFVTGYNRTRFASGGTVPSAPGSNIRVGTDTVPALLTEGEYVINRSSAQKIGYDTLDQLNTYATGGIVGVKQRKKAAMLVMNNQAIDTKQDMTVIVPRDKLSKNIVSTLDPSVDAVQGSFTVAGPSSSYENINLKEQFKKQIKNSMRRIANSVFKTKVENVDDSIYDKVINPQGQGRLFEAVLQSVAGAKIDSSTAVFDFPSPISGELSNIFPGAQGKVGDAKLNYSRSSEINMISKMIRQFGLNKVFKGDYNKTREDYDEKLNKLIKDNNISGTREEQREQGKRQLGISVVPSRVKKFALGGSVGRKRRNYNRIGFLQTLLDDLGIDIKASNIVRKVYIGQTPKGDSGSYNPETDTIFASRNLDNMNGVLLHEFGHAIDSKFLENKLGKRSYDKGFRLSSANIPGFKKVADLYQKMFINRNKSIIDAGGLNRYNPKYHGAESFANAFAAYGIHKGVKSGALDVDDYPTYKDILKDKSGAANLDKLTEEFDKIVPKLKSTKYLPIDRKLSTERLREATRLRSLRKSGMLERGYAKGGVVGRGIKITGGRPIAFGGRMKPYAKGGKITKDFTVDFLNQLFQSSGLNFGDIKNFITGGISRVSKIVQDGSSASGAFYPQTKSIEHKGDLGSALHEAAHAVDYGTKGRANVPEDIMQRYLSMSQGKGSLAKYSPIGQAPISTYDPSQYKEEIFANLSAAHALSQGVESGNIDVKQLSRQQRKVLSDPQVQSLLQDFVTSRNQAIQPYVAPKGGEIQLGQRPPAIAVSSSGVATIPPEYKSAPPSAPTVDVDPNRISSVTQNRIRREAEATPKAVAEQHFQNSAVFTGPPKITQQTSFFKGIFDKLSSTFGRSNSNLDKQSSDMVKVFNRMEGDLHKVVIKLTQDGRELELVSKKGYIGGKRAYNISERISNKISQGGGIQEVEKLLTTGRFELAQNQPATRTGKFKDFVSRNGMGLALAGGILLPSMSERLFGTADKPGSFGTTGAKIGGAVTAGTEGALLGAQLGSGFGAPGIVVGGLIGALTSVIFSLKQFDKEINQVNVQKLSKDISSLNIDPQTGKVSNKLALSSVQSSFSQIKDLDLVLNTEKYLSTPVRERDGIRVSSREERYNEAVQSINEVAEDLINIVKAGITANPNQNLNSIGPKILPQYNLGAFGLLQRTGNTKLIESLKEFQKQAQNSASITEKINSIQEQAYLSLQDLNTAMEVFSNTLERAGDQFQKNAAFNAIGSDALAGRVSSGSSAPNIRLFGGFGAGIEEFAKPGGQFEQARPFISEAIKFGLKTQKGIGENITAEDVDRSSTNAAQFFLGRENVNNQFSKDISKAISSILTDNYGKTKDIPEESLLSKLTEDVVNRFKNIKAFRDASNKQLEAISNVYNQQISGLAERRSTVLQRGVDVTNRDIDFDLNNLQTREIALGSPTRFGPGGAISSNEVLAQSEIGARIKQRNNQLGAFGILPGQNNADLRSRLNTAQKDLITAQKQQRSATNIDEYKTASQRITELTYTISNLKKGMDLLANSTSVLDAKNKALSIALEQQQQDMEGRKSDAEILTFGTTEEKQRLAYKEQLTQTALQNPFALQFATDEEKQLVRERLRESNITRSYQEYDRFGRERGLGFVNSQQQLEGLINPVYQQLMAAPGAQYNRNRVGRAQQDVAREQNNLKANAEVNNQVELRDIIEQRKLMDQNFNQYIKNINDGLNKNAAVFKDFATAADNLAQALISNPIPNTVLVDRKDNVIVSLVGGEPIAQALIPKLEAVVEKALINKLPDLIEKTISNMPGLS